MKKITYNKINEEVYYTTLKNGFNIILFGNSKSKNFNISLSTTFGSKITSYKPILSKNYINIIPGTAHFLEHRVVDFNKNSNLKEKLDDLSSSYNAYTNYLGTTFTIYGTNNLQENINILFDCVFNFDINDKQIKSEIDIISEEIDMYKDIPFVVMAEKIIGNAFNKDYPVNTILGTRNDLEKLDAKYLKKIYNDFYIPNKMFMVVTGKFNVEEINKFITNIIKKYKIKNKKIKYKKINEKKTVNVCFEELKLKVAIPKVSYGLKINIDNFEEKNKKILEYYLEIILENNFGKASKLNEALRRNYCK